MQSAADLRRADLPRKRAVDIALRTLALAIVAASVAAILLTGEPSARLGYPFLDAAPLTAPDIVYAPTYMPIDARPLLLTISRNAFRGVQLEMRHVLETGGELLVWESTRYGAGPSEAVGPFVDDGRLNGTLASWRLAHTTTGARRNLVYARVGETLVVITGPVDPDDLLRIADSLRRSRSSALQL